jgi:CBS domain-containing protein
MMSRMNVGEICNRTVYFAYKHMSISEAARLMHDAHIGSVVVVEETGNGRAVVGMLTDRDIVVSVVAFDLDAKVLRVEDHMSKNVVTAHPDDSINDVLSQMWRNGVRRIPVTDAKNLLIGIVSLDDLLEIVAEEMRGLVQAIDTEQKREVHMRG